MACYVLACSGIDDCDSCSANNVCGACIGGKAPSSDGSACVGKDLVRLLCQYLQTVKCKFYFWQCQTGYISHITIWCTKCCTDMLLTQEVTQMTDIMTLSC